VAGSRPAGLDLDPGLVVTGRSLAALLGVTARHVSGKLLADGAVRQDGGGGYHLFPSVAGYVKFIKDDNKNRSKTETHARLQDVRRRSLELKIARDDHRLVELDEVVEVMRADEATFRAELDGLAASVTRDLALRKKIQDALSRAYARREARLKQSAAALEETGAAPDQRGA
jgi:hypothetical protein